MDTPGTTVERVKQFAGCYINIASSFKEKYIDMNMSIEFKSLTSIWNLLQEVGIMD